MADGDDDFDYNPQSIVKINPAEAIETAGKLLKVVSNGTTMENLGLVLRESHKFIRMADDFRDVKTYLNDIRLCFIVITASIYVCGALYGLIWCLSQHRRRRRGVVGRQKRSIRDSYNCGAGSGYDDEESRLAGGGGGTFYKNDELYKLTNNNNVNHHPNSASTTISINRYDPKCTNRMHNKSSKLTNAVENDAIASNGVINGDTPTTTTTLTTTTTTTTTTMPTSKGGGGTSAVSTSPVHHHRSSLLTSKLPQTIGGGSGGGGGGTVGTFYPHHRRLSDLAALQAAQQQRHHLQMLQKKQQIEKEERELRQRAQSTGAQIEVDSLNDNNNNNNNNNRNTSPSPSLPRAWENGVVVAGI